MSQLPSDFVAEEILRRSKARRADAAVAASRAVTKPGETEDREVRRLSIAELNDADADQVTRMLAKSRFDNRPSIIKAIDLIDTSRNTAANIAAGKPTLAGAARGVAGPAAVGAAIGTGIAPGVGTAVGAGIGAAVPLAQYALAGIARQFIGDDSRERLAKGELAAAGQARISGSDILKEMGVDNRIIRAVVGFGGDLAFDPLTFAGAPGYGSAAKVAVGKGAARATFRKGANKAVSRAAKAAASSGAEAVQNPHLRTVLTELGYDSASVAARRAAPGFDEKAFRSEVAESLFGTVEGGALSRSLELLGADRARGLGALTKHFDEPTFASREDAIADAVARNGGEFATPEALEEALKAQARAANIGKASREFYREFGKGTKSAFRIGLKEGEVGSEVLHLPFTGISLTQVPGFTGTAKNANMLMGLEKGLGVALTASPRVRQAASLANDLVEAARQADAIRLKNVDDVVSLEQEAAAARAAGLDTVPYDDAIGRSRKTVADAMGAAKARIAQDREAIAALSRDPGDLAESVMLARSQRVADAAIRRIKAVADSVDLPEINAATKAVEDVEAATSAAMKALDDLVEIQSRNTDEVMYSRDGEKKVASFSDDVGTKSYLGGFNNTVTVNADPNVVHAVSEQARPIMETIENLQRKIVLAQKGPDSGPSNMNLFDVASDSSLAETKLEDADEISKLRAYLKAARRKLYVVTAPLREGEQISVNEFRARVAANERDLRRAAVGNLLDMAASDRADLRAVVDLKIEAIEAALDLSRAIDAPLVSLLNSGERALAEYAATMLGTNDLTIGASALGSLAAALRRHIGSDTVAARMAEELDRHKRSLFGRRSGEANTVRRGLEAARGEGRMAAFTRAANDISERIFKLAREHKVPLEKRGELFAVALAQAIRSLPKSDQLFRSTIWVGPPAGKGRWVTVKDFLANPDAYPEAYGTFYSHLANAQKSGLLVGNKALQQGVEEIGLHAGSILKELGEHAQDADLLGVLLDAYMPLVMTKQGRDLLSKVNKRFGNALTGKEGFQHSRSTWQYQFRGADGADRRFFEFQRPIGAWSDAELAAAAGDDAAAKSMFEDIRDAIREYDRLPNKPAPMHTDAFELNELMRRGMFGSLTGGANEQFFSTNLAEIVGARVAAQGAAKMRKEATEYFASSGMAVRAPDLIASRHLIGQEFPVGGGATGTVIPEIKGQPAVRIGNRNFRMLNPPASGAANPIWNGMGGEKIGGMVFEESVADLIERLAQGYEGENALKLAEAWDKFLGAWRTVTLFHPSWMLNDAFGNINLWLTGGIDVARALYHWPRAWRMATSVPDESLTMPLRDGRELGTDILEEGFQRGAFGSTQIDETGAMLMDRNLLSLSKLYEKRLATPGERLEQMREWPREVLETIKGPRTAPKKFSESFMRGVVSPWFRLNHRVNVSMRLAALAALMEQGNDLDNAARIVRETMFDFGDMTRFESRTLRRLIPFVSWLRNNTAYQAQLLFQRPVYAANYPRVVSAVEELINGEERVPDHMRPRWLRERLALQVGADPDSRFSLSLRDSIPTGAVYDVMAPITGPEGFMDFMRFFASSTAPGLRSIPEIGARREIFSGREIGPDATRGDISLPEYALGQIRPLRELGVGATRTGPLIRAAEQGPAAFLSRLTLGGRAQDFSAERMDRATLREFQNRDRELRIVIARAERYKNTALSRKSRAELLALYRAMVQAGHEEEVPRWAARQLAEFSR